MVSTGNRFFTFKILIIAFIWLKPLSVVALPDFKHDRLAKKVASAEKKAQILLEGSLRSQQRAQESRIGITKSIHNAIGQHRWRWYEQQKNIAQRNGAKLASHSYRTARHIK